jgi:mRNA-degrading endonuclease RelE of RelBE toxin-antitoxin system
VQDELDFALLCIEANPEEEGIALVGQLRGRRRKSVGGYRIIYRILDGGRLVIVDAIKKRGESYPPKRKA